MRTKDEIKKEALFNATIKIVNDIGFAASSVSKIAKEAKISPATIYIYHINKEDLLVSTYVEIKKKIGLALHKNFDDSRPIKDILKRVWFNMFDYIAAHPDCFQYTEQFASSPYHSLINKQEVEANFIPVINILLKGIEQKIIKDVNFDILIAFVFFPVLNLSNERMCQDFTPTPWNIEMAFTLAWDAIKL